MVAVLLALTAVQVAVLLYSLPVIKPLSPITAPRSKVRLLVPNEKVLLLLPRSKIADGLPKLPVAEPAASSDSCSFSASRRGAITILPVKLVIEPRRNGPPPALPTCVG